MININDEAKLLTISGGVNVTGTIINAFASGIKVLMDVGRSLGTAFRRITLGRLCAI